MDANMRVANAANAANADEDDVVAPLDRAPLVRRSSPPSLRRSGSGSSFVSARDSKFWLAVAVASKSSSSSCSSVSSSSLNGSFQFGAARKGGSSLDLLADEDDEGDERTREGGGDKNGHASPPPPPARHASWGEEQHDLGLSIDIACDRENGDEGTYRGADVERNGAGSDKNRVAPITSPPPLSLGLHRPTILQKHRTRDRLGSDWRPSTSSTGSGASSSPPGSAGKYDAKHGSSPVQPLSAPERLILTPPVSIIEETSQSTEPAVEIVVEEVYEHQRYQRVLGWGSKGHLMPLDPRKYVRVVRNLDHSSRAARRRPSFSGNEPIQAIHSVTFPDVLLPDPPSDQTKWEWMSPWHLEYPVNATALVVALEAADGEDQTYDPDGWIYASSFSQFTSWRSDLSSLMDNPVQDENVCSSPLVNSRGRPKLNVRRRKWVRYRRLRSIAGDADSNDVFCDQANTSPFDDTFLDSMCGWLRKMGHVRKNWKMRYFVLEKSVLRYYADEAMTRLKGEVLLFHPAARVHYVDIHLSNGRDNTFAIQVGPEYTLLLEADRVSDRENWMYCIEDALLCRDSYLQDPMRTQDVRESVARRRNFSSETILYTTNGESSSGINPINMLMLHSKTVVQATRKNPLMMRLMVECDLFLESKQIKQQIAAFIQKFKQKYGAAAVTSTNLQISKTMSPMAKNTGNRRRTSSYEGVDTRSSDVSVIQDPRSLLALKNYRFFLERAMADVMDHLTGLPFAAATCNVTSPRSASPISTHESGFNSEDTSNCDSPPMSGDIDWELAKKAALYKLERQTFVPLQDIIYGLLEATVDSDDLDRFEWNRRYLAKQSQHFFEIQDSQLSPTDWKSARALLDSLDNYSLPTEKASILLEVAKCIYDTYASEHSVDVQMMAADDFLPIFIFILARSRLRNVVVARHLISETMISGVMIGETGYYATMFEAAVSYISSYFTTEENGDRLSQRSPSRRDYCEHEYEGRKERLSIKSHFEAHFVDHQYSDTPTPVMTRQNVWNSCSRVLDEKTQESRREAHRARLESIHNVSKRNVTKPSSTRPQRGTTTNAFKALPKSKSPAAKCRQAEIERENLKMIKKIVELQRGGGSGFGTSAKNAAAVKKRSRPLSASTTRPCQSRPASYRYVPNPLTELAPGGDLGVPTAAPHTLYTRQSATMTHHFEEQNDFASNFVPGKRSTATARQRTQVQILTENREILHRILSSKPNFSRATWQSEERERRKLLENISRYSHLKKRHSSSSGTSTPITSPSRSRLLDEYGHAMGPASTARSSSSQHSLVVVDHVGGNRLDFSTVIRTGSPVTHLRHRSRPQSARAASRDHESVGRSDWHHDPVTHSMSRLAIDRDDDSVNDHDDDSQDENVVDADDDEA